MALLEEDGTGLVGANSYASYADWTAYWADRGDAPAGTQTAVEQALVRAADYLGVRYQFVGQMLKSTQGLEWPRAYAYRSNPASDARCVPIEGVPPEVVEANIELAKRALEGDLVPDPVLDTSGQTLASKRDKVGPLETERVFTGGAPSSWVKRFPSVDHLLRHVVARSGGSVHRA